MEKKDKQPTKELNILTHIFVTHFCVLCKNTLSWVTLHHRANSLIYTNQHLHVGRGRGACSPGISRIMYFYSHVIFQPYLKYALELSYGVCVLGGGANIAQIGFGHPEAVRRQPDLQHLFFLS